MTRAINTSGKHKTAIARATIKEGSGKVRINKRPLEILQPELAMKKIKEPLSIAEDLTPDITSKLDINVNICGGGYMGQAFAARTAIAKGMIEWTNDASLRDAFLDFDRNLLVSDHRKKEPKKFGGRGARAKRQKSYR